MLTSSVAVAEHAHGPTSAPVRDEIVLSANELRDAHRIAVKHPRRAMTYLADRGDVGDTVPPRVAAKYAEAARFVIENDLLPVYDTDKPEPTVTARTTTRVLPAIQTDECGNRYLDAIDGSYRFTYVEEPDDDESVDDFKPRVIADGDCEMDPEAFRLYMADGARFADAIEQPLPSSWNARVSA